MLDAARCKASGMVSEISKEVNPNSLKIEKTGDESPRSGAISPPVSAELKPWFELEALEDVRQMFEQANAPPGQGGINSVGAGASA